MHQYIGAMSVSFFL